MMRDPRSDSTLFFSYFWMYLSFPEDNWGQENKKKRKKKLDIRHDQNALCSVCRCVLDSSSKYRCEASVYHHNTSLRSFSSTSNPVGMPISRIVMVASIVSFL